MNNKQDRIAELEEIKQEYILNESVFADDSPSWGEVAEAEAIAESKWDETDDGKELKSLLPVILDGSFKCPECHFTEKHLASCSHRKDI